MWMEGFLVNSPVGRLKSQFIIIITIYYNYYQFIITWWRHHIATFYMGWNPGPHASLNRNNDVQIGGVGTQNFTESCPPGAFLVEWYRSPGRTHTKEKLHTFARFASKSKSRACRTPSAQNVFWNYHAEFSCFDSSWLKITPKIDSTIFSTRREAWVCKNLSRRGA